MEGREKCTSFSSSLNMEKTENKRRAEAAFPRGKGSSKEHFTPSLCTAVIWRDNFKQEKEEKILRNNNIYDTDKRK